MLVQSGDVILRSVSAAGDESALGLRGPGTLLGIEAVTHQTSAVEARTVTDTVLCTIDPDVFRRWVAPGQTAAGAVLEYAVRETGQLRAERAALSGEAPARVARFLLERFESTGHERLEVSQRLLASVLGIRPETLSRAISSFRREGALAPGRGLVIADAGRLRELAAS